MSQQEKVYKYLQQTGSITSLEMFDEFCICCPQSVIRNLRRVYGYDTITDTWETKKSIESKSDGSKLTKVIKYKRYYLVGE